MLLFAPRSSDAQACKQQIAELIDSGQTAESLRSGQIDGRCAKFDSRKKEGGIKMPKFHQLDRE